MNPKEVADAILSQVEFQDDLMPAEADVASNFYKLDDGVVESHAIYISGTGATAEEVAVLKLTGSGQAAAGEEILRTRVEEQIFRYRDYLPKELVKLENPMIISKGDIIVLVLADDPQHAEEVANSLLNQ